MKLHRIYFAFAIFYTLFALRAIYVLENENLTFGSLILALIAFVLFFGFRNQDDTFSKALAYLINVCFVGIILTYLILN